MAQQSFSEAEARDEIVDRLVNIATTPKWEGGRPNVDPDDEEAVAFLERALDETVRMLTDNAWSAEHQITTEESYKLVDDLLVDENIEEVSVDTNGDYAAPRVYVWMDQSAVRGKRWANCATNKTFKYSAHREHYNGKDTMAILDVRPM